MIACGPCGLRWPVLVPAFTEVEIVREYDTKRVTTPLGVNRRTAGNAMPVEVRVALELEQGWAERLEVEWERVSVRGRTASAGAKSSIAGIGIDATAQRRFEETIRTRRHLTTERRRVFKTVINVPVPANSAVEVVLTWRQVWEVTDCDVRFGGQLVRLSYRVAVEPDFDHVIRPL
jgi:hypothetical protein